MLAVTWTSPSLTFRPATSTASRGWAISGTARRIRSSWLEHLHERVVDTGAALARQGSTGVARDVDVAAAIHARAVGFVTGGRPERPGPLVGPAGVVLLRKDPGIRAQIEAAARPVRDAARSASLGPAETQEGEADREGRGGP